MALVLDTSILVGAERGRFQLDKFLQDNLAEKIYLSAITASELLDGVERAKPVARRRARSEFVESVLSSLQILAFDLPTARIHAVARAALERGGNSIGPHDLIIAAATIGIGAKLVTLNEREFARVHSLKLLDATRYCPS